MASSLERAAPEIVAHLDSLKGGAFKKGDFTAILAANAGRWRIPRSVRTGKFVAFLTQRLGLRVVELESRHYGNATRYGWGTYSPYSMALTLRPRSYLSHGTAVRLHALLDEPSADIYVNQEQSEKPVRGVLTQSRLDAAFAGGQRSSRYVYDLKGMRVVLLSGKRTGWLGVETMEGPLGEELPLTGIPRTLVDIVVRPAYAGEVPKVMEAYRRAQGRADAGEVVRILQGISYVYPYHQSIGFLMERAGYPESDWMMLHRLGAEFDFYLAYGMTDPDYDPKWRLFHPRGL